jgi:signal recognition particle receptor subunit beta
MLEHKIIITGPVGAGKTTAIAAVSEVAPIVTDVANNDSASDKEMTTVGFDYGQLTLDSGDQVRLFGTPGQERFKFMWSTLAKGALGVIILADNSSRDPLSDLSVYLDGFSEQLKTFPCVVGVGRTEQHEQPDLQAYADKLEQHGYLFPVLPVDVRREADVVLLIDSLLSQIEADLL